VYEFRKNHEQLIVTIQRVQRSDKTSRKTEGWFELADSSSFESIQSAIQSINMIDALDTSPEGTELWQAAENQYNDKISKVEQLIIARLKDRLALCSTASDMFRCFSKFNALFIRPKIRGAIHEYQTLLIDRVKDDIKALHKKFTTEQHSSSAISVRDIPPVSAAIIWARQIQHQLELYMKRVEAVLGKGWDQYAEGQKLFQDDVSFQKQLETTHIFDSWLNQVQSQKTAVKGHIFSLVKSRKVLHLSVNFDSTLITVFKEVRNLLFLKFQIPHTVISFSKDVKRIYPYLNLI
jgi:dynein heavy chain 1, cytosolic